MKKGAALIIAFLLVSLIAIDIRFFSSASSLKEKSIIERVIDGDTLVLADGRTIRLLNINSPEKNSNLSFPSMVFMRSFENKTIEIEIIGQDKYKRFLARIYSPYYLNLELVKQGLASKFLVDESELKDFSDAEEYAILNSKGIWKKSSYSSCFSSKIDYSNEKVELSNKCNDLINLNGWQLKDESRKILIFSNISIRDITIHSGLGKDNSTDIFWQLKEPVWNNDRDTLYLLDNKGELAHHEYYGY